MGSPTSLAATLARAEALAAQGALSAADESLARLSAGIPDPARRPFDYVNAIPTPATGTNDAVVLAIVIPTGYDAVFTGYTLAYTGGGFQQGSGAIIWGIRADGLYLRDFEAIKTTRGSLETPRPIPQGIVARSGQLVEIVVSIDAAAPITIAGSEIIGGLAGIFIPKQ